MSCGFKMLFLSFIFLFTNEANATYRNRASVMAGMIQRKSPYETKFQMGVEIETRLRRWIGIGATVNYVVRNPSITLVAAPEFFIHPYKDNWFFNLSPLFQIQAGGHTKVGLRLGTRFLLPMWLLRIGPVFDYDFINGSNQYLLGLCLEVHTI